MGVFHKLGFLSVTDILNYRHERIRAERRRPLKPSMTMACFMCAVNIISVLMSCGHIVGDALCVLFILSVFWWVVVILLAMLYVCCLYYQCFELWSYCWPCFMCAVYIISVLSCGHIVGHALCVLLILSVFWVVVILLAMLYVCCLYYQCFE